MKILLAPQVNNNILHDAPVPIPIPSVFGREMIVTSLLAACDCKNKKNRDKKHRIVAHTDADKCARKHPCLHCRNVKKAQRFLSKKMVNICRLGEDNVIQGNGNQDSGGHKRFNVCVTGPNAAMVQLNQKAILSFPNIKSDIREAEGATGDQWHGDVDIFLEVGDTLTFVDLDKGATPSAAFQPLKFTMVSMIERPDDLETKDNTSSSTSSILDMPARRSPGLSCDSILQHSMRSQFPTQLVDSADVLDFVRDEIVDEGNKNTTDEKIPLSMLTLDQLKYLRKGYKTSSCTHAMLDVTIRNVERGMSVPSLVADVRVDLPINKNS